MEMRRDVRTCADGRQHHIPLRTEAFVLSRTLAADPGDDNLRKLRKARLNAALDEMLGRTLDFARVGSEVDRLLDSGLRLLEVELSYCRPTGQAVPCRRAWRRSLPP